MSSGSVDLGATVGGGSGSGTVTSVAMTAPTGGVFSVSGSPVTTSGTLALAAAGTSGGVPYFASSSTIASSALLTNNQLVLGGGAAAAPKILAATTNGFVLTLVGGVPAYAANAALTAPGSNTQVIFNNSGAFGASSSFTWDGTILTVPQLTASQLNNLSNQSVMSTANCWLTFPNTGSAVVDWLNQILNDASNENAMNWTYRQLIAPGGVTTLWWQALLLQDLSAANSLNWGTRLLFDSSGASSIDWTSRLMYDSTGSDVVIDFQNGYLYHSDVGAGRIAVVDATNAVLRNPNNGDTVFDFGNQQIYDGGGINNINARDRLLIATDGTTTVIDYSSPSGPAVLYTPSDASKWDGTPPTTLAEAINRIAAVVGNAIPIP